ncbi:MAG: hypothetical protein IKH75_10605 [Ruminococcus sp.]|nr:hypothetical protein [Ruminococcus sp.]
MITAIYDCRSKQEYIYRTNKIREISGASALLSKVYDMFFEEAGKNGISIRNYWVEDFQKGIRFDPRTFEKSGFDGEVIYIGGGNLNIIYKDKATYIRANRIFSKMLLDNTYSVSIIAACTETTDNFNADRKRLYEKKFIEKNQGTFSLPCSVLPITLVDRNTFQPVYEKKMINGEPKERTLEARHKRDAYHQAYDRSDKLNTEDLDYIVSDKGDSSILAVIYIDGNDMGGKIQECTKGKDDYPECVDALRRFSYNTNRIFVEKTLEAIREKLNDKNGSRYRKIIGGGDEITLICRGEDALDIVNEYFRSLKESEPLVKGIPNASCAGIALFHSHAPFADIYNIAESCCESGKKATRSSGSTLSYIDFHYCHSGITNDLDSIRDSQEKEYTSRPYSLDDFAEFVRIGRLLGNKKTGIGRSNVKALGEAIIKGDPYYAIEIERIKSRYKGSFTHLIDEYGEDNADLKKIIYDISVVFDLWFGKEEVQLCTD